MSNEANITIDDARALVADEALWPRMRDFLWDFAPQVHASWLEGLGPETAGFMSSPRVKRFVLSSLGVQPCFHDFPKGDWSRLLLLDGPTLEAIAKWLGAIAGVDALRRVTDGATVREMKASLHGIYPEVFNYAMYFNGSGLQRRDAETQRDGGQVVGRPPSVVEDVVSTGVSILVSLLAPLPEALSSRLKFKLPKGWWSAGCETLDMGRERLGAALAKLLKLKFPEAYKLCC